MITSQNGGDAGTHRRDRHRPPSGVLAGLLIGYNRRERAKAAGLRTMLLVCLAASVSMIQVNLLMPTNGRPSDSYVTLDLMRLPLGILTGVGFIGGGAILRRGDIVIGVTTAATLWFVTVLGLCASAADRSRSASRFLSEIARQPGVLRLEWKALA
jgi:uncharacterized membrane protein YhiD involved in acid resistance